MSGAVAEAVRCLVIDQVTAEVVGALAGASIDALLLKGPSLASWLYPDGGRSYSDTDLLVAPESFVAAQSVIVGLGFADVREGFSRHERAGHATTYARSRPGGQPFCVDLHHRLPAVTVDPQELWGALNEHACHLAVAGQSVRIMGPTALAMHVALHAAQHGAEHHLDDHPQEDLRRALKLLSIAQWEASAALASALGAQDAFATGLRLLPAGAAVASALGLAEIARPGVRLAAQSHPRGAEKVLALTEAPSISEKASLLARSVFPTAAAVRFGHPIARRGRFGLMLGYAAHLGRIVICAKPALTASHHARRLPEPDSLERPG